MSLFKISYIQIIFICASLPLSDKNHSCHHFYRQKKIFCLDYLFWYYILDNVYNAKKYWGERKTNWNVM